MGGLTVRIAFKIGLVRTGVALILDMLAVLRACYNRAIGLS